MLEPIPAVAQRLGRRQRFWVGSGRSLASRRRSCAHDRFLQDAATRSPRRRSAGRCDHARLSRLLEHDPLPRLVASRLEGRHNGWIGGRPALREMQNLGAAGWATASH